MCAAVPSILCRCWRSELRSFCFHTSALQTVITPVTSSFHFQKDPNAPKMPEPNVVCTLDVYPSIYTWKEQRVGLIFLQRWGKARTISEVQRQTGACGGGYHQRASRSRIPPSPNAISLLQIFLWRKSGALAAGEMTLKKVP